MSTCVACDPRSRRPYPAVMPALVAVTLFAVTLLAVSQPQSRAQPAAPPSESVEPPPGPAADVEVRIVGSAVVVSGPQLGGAAVRTALLPYPVRAFVRHARFLYAACEDGLLIVDITDPFQPVVTRTLPGVVGVTQLVMQASDTELWAMRAGRAEYVFRVLEPGRLHLHHRYQSGRVSEAALRPLSSRYAPQPARSNGLLITGLCLTVAGGVALGFSGYAFAASKSPSSSGAIGSVNLERVGYGALLGVSGAVTTAGILLTGLGSAR